MYVQDLESSVFSVLVVVNVKLLCQRKCFVVVVVVIFVWLVVCVCVWDLNLIRSPDLKKRFRDRRRGLRSDWIYGCCCWCCVCFVFLTRWLEKNLWREKKLRSEKPQAQIKVFPRRYASTQGDEERSLKTKKEEKSCPPVLFSLLLLANVRERESRGG